MLTARGCYPHPKPQQGSVLSQHHPQLVTQMRGRGMSTRLWVSWSGRSSPHSCESTKDVPARAGCEGQGVESPKFRAEVWPGAPHLAHGQAVHSLAAPLPLTDRRAALPVRVLHPHFNTQISNHKPAGHRKHPALLLPAAVPPAAPSGRAMGLRAICGLHHALLDEFL